jgi:AraC-like DNA-binding protein
MPLPIRLVIIDNELEDWIAILEGLRREPNTIKLLASFDSMSLALPLLEEGTVDVALVGAGLPRFEGVTCAQFLKGRWPSLAVVLMCEKGSEAERKKALTAHGCPCLLQPFQREELMKVVHQAIREACARNAQAVGGLGVATDRASAVVRVAGSIGDYTVGEWREMAKKAKFNPNALAKLMRRSLRDLELHSKARFALTPRVWLNNERMRVAPELLQTHLEIKEIADLLGFKQPSHFSQMFKDYHRFSPRLFRVRLRFQLKTPTTIPSAESESYVNGINITGNYR